MTQRRPKTSLALIFSLILVATSSCGSSTTSEKPSDSEAPTSTPNQAQLAPEGIQEQPPASVEPLGPPIPPANSSADDSNLQGSQTDPEASEEQINPETPEEQTAQGDSENPETPAAPENPADASNAGDLQLDGETPEEQTAQGDSENLETPAASENPADVSEAGFITSEASNRPLRMLRLLLIFVWCGSVSVALAWILFLQNRQSKQLMEIDKRFNDLEGTYLPDALRQLKSKVVNSSSDQTGIITQNDDAFKVKQNNQLLQETIDDLRDQLSQANAELEKYRNEQSKEHNSNNAADSSPTSSTILDNAVPAWVTDYNLLTLGRDDKVTQFSSTNKVQEVAQTEGSLSGQWVGQKGGIYFEVSANTGSYWLIRSLNQQTPVYHIVPNKRKFRFIESALPAMQAYFEFKKARTDGSQNFNLEEIKMNKFKVIRPAEVIEVSAGQIWELKERGLLEF